MPKAKTDKLQCYVCKLSHPFVNIAGAASGDPRGICYKCQNLKARARRNKAHVFNDFYQVGRSLVALNYDTLASLQAGVYTLSNTVTKDSPERRPCGYLAVKDGSTFVELWGEGYLFRPSRYGIATWLSDLGVLIERTPCLLKDPAGEPVPLEAVGLGVPLEDVADKLIMFDLKLQELAYKRLKRELEEAKAKAAGLAGTPTAAPKAPVTRMGDRYKGRGRKPKAPA